MGNVLNLLERTAAVRKGRSVDRAPDSNQDTQNLFERPSANSDPRLAVNPPPLCFVEALARVIDCLCMVIDEFDAILDTIDEPEVRTPLSAKIGDARLELFLARHTAIVLKRLSNG